MTHPTNIPAPRPRRTAAPLFWPGIFAMAVAAWIGICLNSYLSNGFNAVRLIPTFMWIHGGNPYPGPNEAPVTTWIYGPVTLLFFAPAVLASNAFGALLTAFFANLAIAVAPIVAAIRSLGKDDRRLTQTWAFLIAFVLWPANNLVHEQADNVAVLFGVFSMCILSGRTLPDRRGLWLLAFAGVLALWSKSTELGPVMGQIILIGLRGGLPAALRQVMRLAVAGGACGIAFIVAFGAEGLLYNVFVIPSRIPWADLGAKAVSPVYLPYVLGYVVLPLCIVLARWRRFLLTPGPAQAACCFFLLSLPFNIAGFATVGGHINSLHGWVYMIPWLALAAARWRFWLSPALITVALAVQYLPFSGKSFSMSATQNSLSQAERLAKACPCQIYFPWNPLITFYSEKKFYHADDGLLTRALTGEVLGDRTLYGGLPASFNWIAYPADVRPSYLENMLPPTKAYYLFNGWILVSANGLLPSTFKPVPGPGPSAGTTP